VHPLEEARGMRALRELDEPKYSIELIAAKTGKSSAYCAARLRLTELAPVAVDVFLKDEIGVGHALLLAKLQPSEQEQALAHCFREDWSNGNKAKRILLPVRQLQGWIEQNILLILKDAPFSKRDAQLVPAAGSCLECPKRTGFNKLLFTGISENSDACKLCGIWQPQVVPVGSSPPRRPCEAGTSSHLFFWNLRQEVHLPCDFVVHPIRWDRCPFVAADPQARSWLTIQSHRGLAYNTRRLFTCPGALPWVPQTMPVLIRIGNARRDWILSFQFAGRRCPSLQRNDPTVIDGGSSVPCLSDGRGRAIQQPYST
jgi:hypothetical protein